MKKLFYLLSSAALLFGAASCDKGDVEENIVPEVKKTSIVLNATIADDTRTTLDGKKVDWAEGDCIYLVTEDATWGYSYEEDQAGNTIAAYQYTEGAFTDISSVELPPLTEGEEYTVYAMYTNQKSYHRSESSTHRVADVQTQDCEDPTAHIATNDALVGKFTVTGGAVNTVDVTMNHIYTMMEVDVKNTTGKEIKIIKFEMEAEDAKLAGVSTVNFVENPITIDTPTSGSNKITVSVTNGTVANNGSLPIYFVMAPLSNYSGKVTFRAHDANGFTYTKSVTLSNISFNSGAYNTTSYTISTPNETVDFSGTYAILAKRDGVMYYISSDNGSSANNRKAVNTELASIESQGDYAFPNSAMWMFEKVEDTNLYTIKSVATNAWLNKAAGGSNYGKLTTNLTYAEQAIVSYDAANGLYTIYSSAYPTRTLALNSSSSSDYWAFYNGHINTLQLVGCAPNFEMNVSDVTIDAAAVDGGVVDVTVLYGEGWTIAVSDDANWLTTEATLNGSNQVVYNADANDGDVRTATVTLTAKKAGKADVVKTFTIKQNKAISGGITKDFVFADLLDYTDLTELTTAITQTPISILFEKGEYSSSSKYRNSNKYVTFYGKNTMTISGATIRQVTVTFTSESYAGNNKISVDNGNWEVNGAVGVWTGSTNAIIFTNGHTAQARIKSVSVVYE